MAYFFNPLLRDLLQKKQDAATPGDIVRLQGEIDTINENITTINGNLKNKVPKFLSSIEEIEIDEIGEYQGETNETFVNGNFYKRGTGDYVFDYVASREDVFNLAITHTTSEKFYAYWQNYENINYIETPVIQSNSINTISNFGVRADGKIFNVFMIAADVDTINGIAINDDYNIFYDSSAHIYNRGNLAPFASASSWEDEKWYDIKFETGNIYVKLDGAWVQASRYGSGSPRYGWNIYRTNYQYGKCVDCFVFSTSGCDLLFAYNNDNIIDLATIDRCVYTVYDNTIAGWTPKNDTSLQVYSYSRVLSPSVTCVGFATIAQGAKADSALQRINKGTDGNYVTTTVTPKDANNEQSVSVSLSVQPLATADNDHKGLAESSDVKSYIASTTATKAQGTKADTALQGVAKGTDGNYVTTTVTPKDADNVQTISTTLAFQGVATADAQHQGVAEASDVRNYLNIIAATSEAYGVMWDSANPSTSLYRIGNMQNHALLPIQSQMIGGVMADDGTFTPFDNQADWTQATQARDGSDGQVMIRLPKHWRRCSTFGTYNIVMLSPVEIAGYVEVREQYVSAYEATLQHSTSKLASVNNATADYRGGQNEASWDGTYRTLLNRPVTYLNLAEFRTYARNRGNGTKWNCMTYEAVRTIFWLFLTEYATLNSQAEYTSELDANGYHQGGLGIGVSDWNGTEWDNYNGYAPLIPCGVLDEYGNGTAVKNFSIYNDNTTLAHTFQCNKYRGIEMPFAHIWKYVDGVLINVESGDGVSSAYTTIDPANFSSTSVANYNAICSTYRVDSYIKGIVYNPDGDIFATQNGANSTSYYCDQYWGGNLPPTTELRAWLFGGAATSGAHCGLACATSFYVPGNRARTIGSRLCFIP